MSCCQPMYEAELGLIVVSSFLCYDSAYAVDGAEGIVFWGCPSVFAYVLAYKGIV